MSISKVMGSETEYGIYVGTNTKDKRLRAINGNRTKLYVVIREMLKKCPERFMPFVRSWRIERRGLNESIIYGNMVSNGGLFYPDHFHPEFSTPECLSARDLVIWEKAGERIVEECREIASFSLDVPVTIYKDNCDRKGTSFGAHENYLISPALFDKLVEARNDVAQAWISFLATRQIWAGAGKISGGKIGYQLSQRADFICCVDSSDTIGMRAIINTRNISYADSEKFRRLHVIIGDANMAEYSIWLKFGLSVILLEILEDGFAFEDLPILEFPVHSVKEISKDLILEKKLKLIDERQMSALDIQEWFSDLFHKWYFSSYIPKKGKNDSLEKLIKEHRCVLDVLRVDPMKLADKLDCWIKLKLLRDYIDKNKISWKHWRAVAIDMTYHNIEKKESIFYHLQDKGKVKRLITDEEINRAMLEPPSDTRAYFRSLCLKKFSEDIRNISWDQVVLKDDQSPLFNHFAIFNITPFRGTREDCFGLESVNLKEFKKILEKETYLRVRRTL